MRSFFHKALRLVPVAMFVFVGSAVFGQTPQQLIEAQQYKAKIDANLDNPYFDLTAAQAELDAMMAAYGITEIPAEPVQLEAFSALSQPAPAVPITSTLATPEREAHVAALKADIELFKDNPDMADYVKALRVELAAIEN